MLGGLLKSIGSSLGLAAPKPPVFAVPAALPGLQVPSAAALVEKAGVKLGPEAIGASRDASALLEHLLNEKQDMLAATQVLAHGLPPREGVKWAVDSCKRVESKLPPEARQAIMAADEFALVPNASNRALATATAEKVGLQSPAGLAAKAASLANVPDAPPIPGGEKLVPACVAGSVICAVALSAAKPAKPEVAKPTLVMPELPKAAAAAQLPPVAPLPGPGSPESARNANAFQPFIAAGLAIAAGVAAARSK